jgi:4-amino-4-deoxy-L-arabinose transferase-like glycosyltransferase
MAPLRSFPMIRQIAASPCKAFIAFAALHAMLWTALPSLLYLNLPLDLIEALTYGREWQLGYDKLPPLPWWLVEITYRLIGHDFAYYLLAQAAVIAALAAVFAMARPLIGGTGALVAVLIVDGLHYLNFTAAKFNHDVIQLPFWALTGFALHRALRGNAARHWLLLGVTIGISLWAKYFVVVLAAPMALFLLVDRDARKALATPGPYVAVAAALVVMAPHLIWLMQNNFLPFAYAEHRAVPSRGLIDHVWHPLQFVLGQSFFLLPALFIAAPLFVPRKAAGEQPVALGADAFDRRIVAWLAFGPVAAVLVLAAVSGRGTIAMWGYPIWLYLGVFLVIVAHRALDEKRLGHIVGHWAVVFVGLTLAFIADYAVMPQYDHRYRAVFYPGREIATELTQRYRAVTGQSIVYVIGGMWDGGNVAHYAADHPRVLIDGEPARAPWINLADLRRRGALVIWTAGDLRAVPPKLRTIAVDAAVQAPFTLEDLRGGNSTTVGWAILQPQPSFAKSP